MAQAKADKVKTVESPLLALGDQCEQAAGPDRELDTAVFATLNPELFPHKTMPHFFVDSEKLRNTEYQSRHTRIVPPYTASLDAAMTLVPEGYGWRLWIPNSDSDETLRVTMWGNGRSYAPWDSIAATPALALCAAALRARAA